MPDPDDLGTHDGHTIDVGPVSCPACKRPYVSAPTLTEEEVRRLEWAVSVAFPNVASERDAALASLRRLSGSTSTGGPAGSEAADHAAMAYLRNRGVTYNPPEEA